MCVLFAFVCVMYFVLKFFKGKDNSVLNFLFIMSSDVFFLISSKFSDNAKKCVYTFSFGSINLVEFNNRTSFLSGTKVVFYFLFFLFYYLLKFSYVLRFNSDLFLK